MTTRLASPPELGSVLELVQRVCERQRSLALRHEILLGFDEPAASLRLPNSLVAAIEDVLDALLVDLIYRNERGSVWLRRDARRKRRRVLPPAAAGGSVSRPSASPRFPG